MPKSPKPGSPSPEPMAANHDGMAVVAIFCLAIVCSSIAVMSVSLQNRVLFGLMGTTFGFFFTLSVHRVYFRSKKPAVGGLAEPGEPIAVPAFRKKAESGRAEVQTRSL